MFNELAAYYDLQYGWKDYAAEAKRVDEIIRKQKRSPGNALLDVACGTGGHIRHLRDRYEITGIDLSRQMLRIARRHCPGIPLREADMTDFSLGRPFDAIVCLFSAIADVRTYANAGRTLRCFAAHLKPGGVALIEPFVSPQAFQAGLVHHLSAERDGVTLSRMCVTSRRGNLGTLDFHFLIGTSRGVRYIRDTHRIGLFEPGRFISLMKKAGFEARYEPEGFMKDRGLYIGIRSRR